VIAIKIVGGGKMSPNLREEVDGITDFEKAVAKAEELSRAAREAAGKSTKSTIEAARRAEQAGLQAKRAAEDAARTAREAIARAERISREAKEAAELAMKAAAEAISRSEEPITRVAIDPADVLANPEALERILEADLIVVGPGSLFSSVLPNLLINDIRDAIAAASGIRVYVCNVATQPGETGSFSASQHLEALADHVGEGLFDFALLNDNREARRPEGWLGQPVLVDVRRLEGMPVTIVEEDLVDPINAHRHDPAKLAAALIRIQQEDRAERFRPRRSVRRPTASAG